MTVCCLNVGTSLSCVSPTHHPNPLPSANLLTFPPGCQKDFALAQYGEKFAQAGFASFIFDYRTFGGSEGLPRHWASPARHLDDYMSAVQYVKEQLGGEVDVSKLNLWGSSFSGGHVLTLAGSKLRDEVTAVIAQVRDSVKTSLHGRNGFGYFCSLCQRILFLCFPLAWGAQSVCCIVALGTCIFSCRLLHSGLCCCNMPGS